MQLICASSMEFIELHRHEEGTDHWSADFLWTDACCHAQAVQDMWQSSWQDSFASWKKEVMDDLIKLVGSLEPVQDQVLAHCPSKLVLACL